VVVEDFCTIPIVGAVQSLVLVDVLLGSDHEQGNGCSTKKQWKATQDQKMHAGYTACSSPQPANLNIVK
jgi:hypothetical protein